MPRLTLDAFAKINLSLRIGAKRADGFHDVRTVMQAIDLADRVTCESRRGPFAIDCATDGVPADRTNLVWKAAQELWTAAGRDGEPRDAVIQLEKHIPMQAGLGGGSSDAAAALVVLREVWKMRVPDDALLEIASRLGSDVPFFFVGGTALGVGRGEEVYPLDALPRWWVVLVIPPFGVPTAAAYGWLDDDRAAGTAAAASDVATARMSMPGTWFAPLARIVPLVNDLEAPVVRRHPVIGALTERLAKLGAVAAAMSGSGSTVFGLFPTAKGAEAATKRLQAPGARVLTARMQNRP